MARGEVTQPPPCQVCNSHTRRQRKKPTGRKGQGGREPPAREATEAASAAAECEADEAACERECEAPGSSLSPVTCRDCGAPFDVGGHERRHLRKEGKCDPLS